MKVHQGLRGERGLPWGQGAVMGDREGRGGLGPQDLRGQTGGGRVPRPCLLSPLSMLSPQHTHLPPSPGLLFPGVRLPLTSLPVSHTHVHTRIHMHTYTHKHTHLHNALPIPLTLLYSSSWHPAPPSTWFHFFLRVCLFLRQRSLHEHGGVGLFPTGRPGLEECLGADGAHSDSM